MSEKKRKEQSSKCWNRRTDSGLPLITPDDEEYGEEDACAADGSVGYISDGSIMTHPQNTALWVDANGCRGRVARNTG